MSKSPRVSVIAHLSNVALVCVAGIKSILDQSFTDFECILFNDGSSDETDTCIRSFTDERLRYIHCTEEKGLSHRLNQGLSIARGEYIACCCAEAVSAPHRLALHVAAFEKEPALVACGSWWDVLSDDPLEKTFFSQNQDPAEIVLSFLKGVNPLLHSATMFKKSALVAVEGYSETFRGAEDFDLLNRLVLQGGLIDIIERPLVTISRASESSDQGNAEKITAAAGGQVTHSLYAGLGCADPFQCVLMRSFFDTADTFIALLDQTTWQIFRETIETVYYSLARIYAYQPACAERFCDEISGRLDQVQLKLQSFTRLKEKLQDKDFARRVTPERKIKIDELCAVSESLEAFTIRDLIARARDVTYV
jgi:glycosyltransferase involved in cell wall biosynthesis